VGKQKFYMKARREKKKFSRGSKDFNFVERRKSLHQVCHVELNNEEKRRERGNRRGKNQCNNQRRTGVEGEQFSVSSVGKKVVGSKINTSRRASNDG
jgi:hypothetical protein